MDEQPRVLEIAESELEESVKEVAQTLNEVDVTTKLPNYSVDDILEKCNNEEQLSSDIPYENVRNNSKIFLIYFAKSQLQRVIKLSKSLEELEDRLILNSSMITDPDTLMRIIGTIQSSLLNAISLIDKVSTNDNYVKFVFNDNRSIVNNINEMHMNSTNNVNLSRESRMKLREIAESLLTKVDNVIDTEAKEIIDE